MVDRCIGCSTLAASYFGRLGHEAASRCPDRSSPRPSAGEPRQCLQAHTSSISGTRVDLERGLNGAGIIVSAVCYTVIPKQQSAVADWHWA